MSAQPYRSVSMDRDPLWYKDAVIYQTHVRSFYDSNGDGIGDFIGLTEKLDYLSKLGISALWLLPFYPSPRKDDGYDIADYRGIHPEYGTIRDFRLFLREAHRRGIRVITELVINHTSDQHPWFQSARRARPGSPKRDFYVWSDTDQKFQQTRIIFCDTESSNWTWDPVANAYFWHRFYSHQPDLNLNNPRVVQAVIKVLKFWLDMGVDGVRLDAVPYLCVREGTNNENLPETHEVIRQLRSFVDRNYPDRMLLAEANQWPEDVRPYFGDGDECHMAFHFPLMPRIFIALRREDRHPIVDIIERTPEIPPSCQWGLFLRNHDELTLEMVSEDERDYMYREYAQDPRMRLNLGIRRRLAPLVENSTRRLEMLTGLLFSFPGSPIMYYGDELGMGDNVYLGDRHGVRTPMQWSYDRNGGFSKADPARLYLPTVMDPVYGFQAVNVEAQERNPSSLLNFVRRLVSLRRQYKAFGRGRFEFLHPANRRVLAYLREFEDEVILCICNLSRFTQPAELDLGRFRGWTPMELIGRTEFPPIGELPYFLTLSPHSFMWFKLEPEPQPLSTSLSKLPDGLTPATILLDHSQQELFERQQLPLEIQEVLLEYVTRQRWYQGKAKNLITAEIREAVKIGAHCYFLFLDASYDDATCERYFLPVRMAFGSAAEELVDRMPEKIIGVLRTPTEGGVLVDALFERRSCQLLLAAMQNERRFEAGHIMRVHGHKLEMLDQVVGQRAVAPMRAIAKEQSNTSLVFGEQLILKAFRNLRIGVNPELEITRYLSEQSSFRNIPQLAGWIDGIFSDGATATLVVLQEFVENHGDGWSYILEQLERFYNELDPAAIAAAEDASRSYLPARDIDVPVPPELVHLLGSFGAEVALLGQRTAELHLALARATDDSAFQPERITTAYIQNVATVILGRITAAIRRLGSERLPTQDPSALTERLLASSGAVSDSVHALEDELSSALQTRASYAIRYHGDFHLGQVMKVREDFYIFDFEGEPLLPLEERRRKHSPLKDVAGMLRSFSYAGYAGAASRGSEHASTHESAELGARGSAVWVKAVSAQFLATYRETCRASNILNSAAEDFSKLLHLFLLDKEFYELDYEIAYRPSWIHIPLKGILEHIEKRPA
ncbi:MAG: maltose alpha-D-glucosyltransferase [Bdellovibrionales bacterium]|nr:maltose alpha-D-glucosyltransferase [Bdellovibrionales bacterium]